MLRLSLLDDTTLWHWYAANAFYMTAVELCKQEHGISDSHAQEKVREYLRNLKGSKQS